MEEQHRFRSHRRMQERLATANVVVDKVFHRVVWPALWAALQEHNA